VSRRDGNSMRPLGFAAASVLALSLTACGATSQPPKTHAPASAPAPRAADPLPESPRSSEVVRVSRTPYGPALVDRRGSRCIGSPTTGPRRAPATEPVRSRGRRTSSASSPSPRVPEQARPCSAPSVDGTAVSRSHTPSTRSTTTSAISVRTRCCARRSRSSGARGTSWPRTAMRSAELRRPKID